MHNTRKCHLLSDATCKQIDHWVAKFPVDKKRSAVLQSLSAVQDQNGGWITTELMDAVAQYLELPNAWVYEVASFYSMFDTEPQGRHKVAICKNISCMLRGADDVVDYIENKLHIKLGETTEDGRITLKCEEECLAACCGAPMMLVDGHYHENLTTDSIDQILDALD